MNDEPSARPNLVVSPANWETRRDQAEELVSIPIGEHVRVRMRKSEAIALGLWKPPAEAQTKRRKRAANKMRAPGEDK